MSSTTTWIARHAAWSAQAGESAPQLSLNNPYRGATILVVDDDPTQRILAREALEAVSFKVEEAADGPEGVAKAFLLKPDLIILDIVMPILDGFTVCAELRRHSATQHIPILIATGVNDAASIERGFQMGATDFMNKPIPWQILALRVKYMLRNAGTAEMDQLPAQ